MIIIKYILYFILALIAEHLFATMIVSTFDIFLDAHLYPELASVFYKRLFSIELLMWSGIFGTIISYAIAHEKYLKDKRAASIKRGLDQAKEISKKRESFHIL